MTDKPKTESEWAAELGRGVLGYEAIVKLILAQGRLEGEKHCTEAYREMREFIKNNRWRWDWYNKQRDAILAATKKQYSDN